MGRSIAELLHLFAPHVDDKESNSRVLELVSNQTLWRAGHVVFDEVRRRRLVATKQENLKLEYQYYFEESCCQALYNAIEPPDPFDPSSAFYVAPSAISFAKFIELQMDDVLITLCSAK